MNLTHFLSASRATLALLDLAFVRNFVLLLITKASKNLARLEIMHQYDALTLLRQFLIHKLSCHLFVYYSQWPHHGFERGGGANFHK